jgi:3-phenylpropionate/cinnamic acid dioxygenase small subunit
MAEKIDIIISSRDKVEEIWGNLDQEPKYLFNGKSLDNSNTNKPLRVLENETITEILNNFVGEQFENTLILTGAGASILNGWEEDKDKPFQYSGKTVAGLTAEIDKFLNERLDLLSLEEFSSLIKYFNNDAVYDVKKVNIEDLLSRAESAKEYIYFETSETGEKFNNTLKEIEYKIKELCSLKLHQDHVHRHFLNKVTLQRKSHNRVKIFTTNYDTLFEQAAQQEGFVVVDGFTYTLPRTFNPFMFDLDFVRRSANKVIDEPDYVEKVIHLYKLHGSIDWEKNNSEIIKKEDTKNPLMIYPRRNKFEQSYEAPYFEMFSRFQLELRKKNTLFMTFGFSFADKHIQTIVENAMINNPSLKILIVDYNLNQDGFQIFKERAENYDNVMLYQGTFADFSHKYQKQKAYSDELFSIIGDRIE